MIKIFLCHFFLPLFGRLSYFHGRPKKDRSFLKTKSHKSKIEVYFYYDGIMNSMKISLVYIVVCFNQLKIFPSLFPDLQFWLKCYSLLFLNPFGVWSVITVN